MVIDMRKLEQIKIKLYIALAVLAVSFACICIYRSAVAQNRVQQPRPSVITEEQLADTNQVDTKQPDPDNRPASATIRGSEKSSNGVPAEYTQAPQPEQTTYALAVSDGCLQVYVLETGQLYMETTIAYDLLPEDVRAQIDTGKHFDTEETLLEFLESYSS